MASAVFDLSGRVALVTGGNRGIGRAIALALAEAGADVAIAARDETATAAVVEEIKALGRRALGLRCEVTRHEDRVQAVERTCDQLGDLTILVNNAAISRRSAADAVTEAEWDEVMDTNLRSAYLLCKAAYPALVTGGGGKIINIGSSISLRGAHASVAYGASKAALINITMSLAVAWGENNIQVNAIMPGPTVTEMTAGQPGHANSRMNQLAPAGRPGRPDDYGGAAIFLASRASDHMTGQALAMDGGLTVTSAMYARPMTPP